jgi:protein-tyrosine kinase
MKEKIDLNIDLNRESLFRKQQPLPEQIVYSQTRQRPISHSYLKDNRIISPFDQSPVVDAYKILRTQLTHRLVENGWNTIGITSPREGEGKTLTSINLAVSFSTLANRSVLLIDADFQGPQIHHLFGIEAKGVVNYLLDEDPIEDLLINPGLNKLILFPAGRTIQNSSDLLVSSKMLQMVKEVKHRYKERIVLFDLPPLLPSADVLAFSPHLDAILLVIESGKTQERDLIKSVEMLQGVPIIGTVLNKV